MGHTTRRDTDVHAEWTFTCGPSNSNYSTNTVTLGMILMEHEHTLKYDINLNLLYFVKF